MTSVPCRFDESLPRLVAILARQLSSAQLESGVLLRDATGRLCFLCAEDIASEAAEVVESLARLALGPYARTDGVVRVDRDRVEQLTVDPAALMLNVDLEPHQTKTMRYVDRRIVGADWLRRPGAVLENVPETLARPARFVFSSLKGGVGRSTALSVVAAEQARKGRNVLVIDLDLEAPGVGSLLLDTDRMPGFGVIDYLVERNFGPAAGDILADMVGTSALAQGHGLVDVVPAVGLRTLDLPSGYLAKLSRAVLETIDADEPVSFAEKLREMVSALEAQRHYDYVFLDVRAGLAEIAAGPILALDAEVLIFGTAQRQTTQDLSFLFAHLAMLAPDMNPSPWNRLKMVHAKAAQVSEVVKFRSELWELFSENLYIEAVGLEGFNFDVDAPEAPHYPVMIPLDPAFADWDPVQNPDRLVDTYYARTYGDLISYVEDASRVDEDGEK